MALFAAAAQYAAMPDFVSQGGVSTADDPQLKAHLSWMSVEADP